MKKFLKAALIRMGHTMAQTALSIIGTSALISEVNWTVVLSGTLMAGIISFLKSCVIGMPEVERGDKDE